MSMGYVGEIRMFGGTFAPAGWAFCNGALLPIAGNEVVFALVGTMYGGDGVQSFALPDLRGRVPVHQGQGPGLSPCTPGQTGGAEAVTVTAVQMAVHTHTAQGASGAGTAAPPAGNVWAANPEVKQFAPGSSATGTMSAGAVGASGGGQAHDNMAPYLPVNFIICLNGLFPNRS